jgi:hypothetical protein
VTIKSKNIKLFENLSIFEIEGLYYDFHNNFYCFGITLKDNNFILLLKNIEEEYLVYFKFENMFLEKFEFLNFEEFKNLTIDSLYRGRFEEDGRLVEFNNRGQSYFYIEFYEGLYIELWCENIVVEQYSG